MEEQLIEFSTAKLAKEKGFDIETLHFYTKPNSKIFGIDEKGRSYPIKNIPKKVYTCGEHAVLNIENAMFAPTQSLLQRWLREEHRLFIEVYITNNHLENIQVFEFLILKPNRMIIEHKISDWGYITYEETLEAGLHKALSLIK